MVGDGLAKVLAGNARDRRFTRGVDRQQRQAVRLIEGGDEIVETFVGAAVAMRLEDHVHASTTQARGGDGGAHLGWMVAVVLDHTDAERIAMHGEAAAYALAARQG